MDKEAKKKIREMSKEEFKKYNRDRARELRKKKHPQIKKNCIICGKEFILYNKNKKYLTCSEKCRKKYTWENRIGNGRNNAERRYKDNIKEEREKRKQYGRNHSKEAVERVNKWAKEHPERVKINKNKWKREHYGEQKEKLYIRNLAQKIPLKSNCQICGSVDNLQRHHQDYTKPYDVITVCAKCHTNIHREERYGF